MDKQGKKGFTLMEMLIVVAIIAILIAIAIPVYSNSIKKTQETVCLGNRRSMLSEMTYTAILEELDQDKANQIIGKYPGACPGGGTISAALSEAGITLSCSVHGGESGRANVSRTYVQDYIAFIQDPDNGLASNMKYSNDRLREAFYAKYGNTWPTLIIDGARYQIEPYFSSKGSGKEDLSDYVWLFARKEGSTNGVANNWNVPLVYNPKTGQWYECLNYNGTAQGSTSINSFADVTALETALLNDKLSNGNLKWRPVTDWEEIWPESQ